ncbi:MAG TPA: hypothetical protein VFL14_06350 [Xanthomonadales bacterium]|nr:hypothetical protein [Xanthomonadales bacterium]
MGEELVTLSSEEHSTLTRIAAGTLHIDCLTRPRAVASLLDLGLIECDGDHFIATTRAIPYLEPRVRERSRG